MVLLEELKKLAQFLAIPGTSLAERIAAAERLIALAESDSPVTVEAPAIDPPVEPYPYPPTPPDEVYSPTSPAEVPAVFSAPAEVILVEEPPEEELPAAKKHKSVHKRK